MPDIKYRRNVSSRARILRKFCYFSSGALWYPSYSGDFANYVPAVFSPAGVSAGYNTPFTSAPATLLPQYGVCSGLTVTPIGRLLPLAVSDNGQVLGDATDVTDNKNSLSVYDGATPWLLSSRLPAQYQNVVRFRVP